MKLSVLYILVTTSLCFTCLIEAQTFVENYQYTGNQLDSSKWIDKDRNFYPLPSISFDGSNMNLQSFGQGEALGAIKSVIREQWYQSIPLNQNWTILQRFKILEPTDTWVLSQLDLSLISSNSSLLYNNYEYAQLNPNSASRSAYVYDQNYQGNTINFTENFDYHWMDLRLIVLLNLSHQYFLLVQVIAFLQQMNLVLLTQFH